MTDIAATRDLPRPGRWPWFGAFAILFLIGSEAFAILTSPPDRDMGDLQKIMYVHVPSAWMSLLAPVVVLIFSLRYLMKGREDDDLLAASAAEVGAVLSGLTLVLGMIWGRPAWGVWWTWDARLTSMLVLFLILVYLYTSLCSQTPSSLIRRSASSLRTIYEIPGTTGIPLPKSVFSHPFFCLRRYFARLATFHTYCCASYSHHATHFLDFDVTLGQRPTGLYTSFHSRA